MQEASPLQVASVTKPFTVSAFMSHVPQEFAAAASKGVSDEVKRERVIKRAETRLLKSERVFILFHPLSIKFTCGNCAVAPFYAVKKTHRSVFRTRDRR